MQTILLISTNLSSITIKKITEFQSFSRSFLEMKIHEKKKIFVKKDIRLIHSIEYNLAHPVYLRKFHKPRVHKPIIPNTSPLLIFHCSSPLSLPISTPHNLLASRKNRRYYRRREEEKRGKSARNTKRDGEKQEIYRAGGESAQIFGSDDLEATRRGTRRMFRVTEPPYMENHRRCNLRHCLPATRIVYNGAIHFSYGRVYELLS